MIKAVIVGINQYPQSPLSGCVNDATDVISHLTERLNVAHADITPLYDSRATKDAIVRALSDMIASSNTGDHLLFHYSGHGAQIASQNASEPDVLDECLCPVDFDWNVPSTAITDNELADILATVPPGTALTVVLDSCHSGDMIRDFRDPNRKPRCLIPPPDIAWRLTGRKRHVRKRSLSSPNGVVVSACRSDETAADTSFDGRPNGAFTYNWLAKLKSSPEAAIDSIIAALASTLATFGMHPEDEGNAQLEAAAFLVEPPPTARGLVPNSTGTTTGKRVVAWVVFDQEWPVKIPGMDLGVHLRISVDDAGFQFALTSGTGLSSMFSVTGNTSQPIDLGWGVSLLFAVENWSVNANQVEFDLNMSVTPPSLPFVPSPPFTIVRQHIALPLSKASRSFPAPSSAVELYAALQLLQMQHGLPSGAFETHMPWTRSRGVTVTNDTPFVAYQDRFGWGPNWSEDRSVLLPRLAHNQVRSGDSVVFFNQQGAGSVGWIGWLNDDPNDPSFKVHIGNGFFGGWGSIGYQVMAVEANIDGMVNRGVQKPSQENGYTSKNGYTNGNGRRAGNIAGPFRSVRAIESQLRELADELKMEDPEAGGSIRA